MRVGLVPFLNAAPFSQLEHELIYAPPTMLNTMMLNGELDCALTSSIVPLDGKIERIPHLGLATKSEIRSVNLYLRGPLEGASLCLDPRSGTSNLLLEILTEDHKVSFTTDQSSADGFILIGDDALKQQHIPGYETIDLAKWWVEKTSLPFVFALFTKQIGIDTSPMEEELYAIIDSVDSFLPKLAKREDFPEKDLREYFDLFTYKLGPDEERGLNYFYECKSRVGQGVLL